MSKIVIDVPPETYKRLQEQARRVGKSPEALTRELLEASLRTALQPTPLEILRAAGRVGGLDTSLRRRIIPGVTLDEVRASLNNAGGPPLSEIVLGQRGPKA